MSSTSEDQMLEYRDCFSLFDRKGDGKIECRQIGDVLRSLGQNPTSADVNKIVNEIDKYGDKRITFEEFLPILHSTSQKRSQGSQEDFVEGLRVFDRDGSGTVMAAELRHVLTGLGEKLSDEEVDQLFVNIEDTTGHINYEEFVKMVMSG